MDENKWHALDISVIENEFSTNIEKGLDSELAQKLLKNYGKNELQGKSTPSLLDILLSQFNDFLVIILLIASLVSLFIGQVTDSIVIMLIILLNAVLGTIEESRANNALEALKKMASPEAQIIRNGKMYHLPASEIVPGDLVLIEAGNYVPADLRLIESVNLKVDESSLTGESVPVEKNAEKILNLEVPLGDRLNSAFMGTIVTYGRGKGIVVATGMKTQMGMIAKMLESYGEDETPLQKKLGELGKILGISSIAICGIVFLLGISRGIPAVEMFMTAISLAVAAIPEGLPAIVTIVLALGMQRMVKHHSIIKKLHAVETLGSTTVICSDKTGTLTQNEMTAKKIYVDDKMYSISGEGYAPFGRFSINGLKTSPEDDKNLNLLLNIGALCNDSKLEKNISDGKDAWNIMGDPTEGALIVAAKKAGLSIDALEKTKPRLQEIPFDSERKRMTTFHPHGNKFVAYIKGAPDIILNLSNSFLKDGKLLPLTNKDRKHIFKINNMMAKDALRVLAFAFKPLDEIPEELDPNIIEQNLTFVGLLGMIDPARPEAKEAIQICKQAGIRPIMITGDYKDTAAAIAKDLEIMQGDNEVLTGEELDNMSYEELQKAANNITVYTRVSPAHKLKIIDAIKNNGHVVAMTGDGVNDAPALKIADIGIAMGITGTDVAKETAEMILTDDNFASIVAAVKEGRVIYSNIRKFIFFLLSCNIAEILIIFVAMLIGLPIPLKPIQLLWLNLLTDAFPALALGMEKQEPHIMKIKPRKPDEPILDSSMKVRIALQSLFMMVSVLGAFIYALSSKDINHARTYAFTTLIFSELLRAYTSRSETTSVFKIGLCSNKYMVAGTLISFILLIIVIYIPFLRSIFDTVFLTWQDWYIIFGFGVIPAITGEITKLIHRNKKPSF